MTGSRVRSGLGVAAIASVVLASTAVAAQDQPPQGNPERGKALSYTCLGCHGIEGYRNAYPNYSVPRLQGQHPEYLAAALQGYRSGDRSHLTMHSQASTLTDQDIADIAAYFAGKPLVSSNKAPGSVPQAATLCVSCHGQDGVGIAPTYPTLAGQHADYIARALDEYQRRRSSRRRSAISTRTSCGSSRWTRRAPTPLPRTPCARRTSAESLPRSSSA